MTTGLRRKPIRVVIHDKGFRAVWHFETPKALKDWQKNCQANWMKVDWLMIRQLVEIPRKFFSGRGERFTRALLIPLVWFLAIGDYMNLVRIVRLILA